jgi:hypothetical protein
MPDHYVVNYDQIKRELKAHHHWQIVGNIIGIAGCTAMFLVFAAIFIFLYTATP